MHQSIKCDSLEITNPNNLQFVIKPIALGIIYLCYYIASWQSSCYIDKLRNRFTTYWSLCHPIRHQHHLFQCSHMRGDNDVLRTLLNHFPLSCEVRHHYQFKIDCLYMWKMSLVLLKYLSISFTIFQVTPLN